MDIKINHETGFIRMQVKEVEQQIIDKIQEITNVKTEINEQTCTLLTKNIREFRIKKILILSSSFDYFLLEEEGRLRNIFLDWSELSEQYYPPTITHVDNSKDLFEKLQFTNYDLIIIFNMPPNMGMEELSLKIKEKTSAPLILLHNNISEITRTNPNILHNFDKCFTWNGDGKIILSIVQFFEDKINLNNIKKGSNFRAFFLIEDSKQYYSSYFTVFTEELYRYLKQTINESLNCEQKEQRFQQRPFIIHSDDYDEAKKIYETHKNNIQFILSDNYIEKNNKKDQIGIELANIIHSEGKNIPILIQSSEPSKKGELLNKNTKIISKSSPKLVNSIREYIRNHLAPHYIKIKTKKGYEIIDINNIKELENVIKTLDDKTILSCAKNNDFSKWLFTRGDLDFSKKYKDIELDCSNVKELKRDLLEQIENYQYSINQTAITSFSQRFEDPTVKINRIGEGALGGKARGLAFLAKVISKYLTKDLFPNLKITIPRSIVLTTDVFDAFMDYNKLNDLDFYHLSDDRISSKFVKGDLPATVLGDLRSFIRNTRKPLIVRSSGLLEDSLMQPFAGIYASMLLPNDSWETDLRFQEVCNAIKHVFSSTYFERARTYIKSTPKHMADEKMAVLIQEIVGNRHGNYFYPTISGVAKSYNYYPSSACQPEDGIAYLAMGLGKAIVDGGSSFAFCPEKPKKPLFGTPKEYMKYAQTSYYALDLRSIYKYVNVDEETSLDKLDLETAKKHGILDKIVSTYIYQDDQIYPGIYEDGSLVVDFGPIISYNLIPLAKAVNLLLRISEIALGYPVEIEFAVNISKEDDAPSELIVLQIRNMVPPDKQIDVNLDEIEENNIVIQSGNCLGHGISSDIYDIVYVDQDVFDMSKSIQVVDQIRKMNDKLMDEKTPYVLIGPGRWGSSDQWLGIPVLWSNIAGAKAIVEVPYKERHIDPSQGSHFFHDMIASDVKYLITKKSEDINWEWIKGQELVEKSDFIYHVKTKNPFEIIVDGKKGKGVLIKKEE